jgi:electron transfer flavoprotein-quinone oxidoreductase
MEQPDAIIVGAGPAGSAAALRLAQKGLKPVIIDRGMPVGSKNLSGGVLWGNDLAELLPDWQEEAPIERYILNKKVGFLSEDDATVLDFHFNDWNTPPYAGWSVLRAKFDTWLAEKATEAGAAVLSGINIDSLIEENGKIVGIRQGDDELRAPVVIIAEGANPRLMLKHGLTYDPEQTRYDHSDYMIGVKEVFELNQEKLEERFLLDGNQGIAGEFILGNVPDGVMAGGFFYTNRNTLSVGVVVHLDSFTASQDKSANMQSYKVIEYFKNHPYIARLLKDATSIEYGAKLVPEYGYKKFPKHFGDGFLVVGDAAGFTFSNGLVIQGINYAIKSGILAADAVIEAKQRNDYSASSLQNYQAKLKDSYIYKDFKNFQNVKKMTKNPRLFHVYPAGLNNAFKELLTEDGSPKDHVLKTVLRNFKKSGAGIFALLKDGFTARHL